jgi:hypothetical protein
VLAPAEADFKSIFGVESCYRDPNVQRYGLENVLFPIGSSFIEIVSPTRPGTAAGRFLEQRGGRGGYMVILDCDDAERRRQHAENIGIRVANLLRYDDYLGVQLHPRDTGAAMIEFNQTRGGDNITGPYHPAGPDWQDAVRTDVTTRLVAVDIEAPDPATFAQRWAGIIERPAVQSANGQYCVSLDDGEIRFSTCFTSGQAMFSGLEVQVVNRAKVLQMACDRGYATDDSGFELCGVTIKLSESA